TETDCGDLSYFNNYHLKVIERAISELHDYLEAQQVLVQEACELLENYPQLNYRQRDVILDAIKHPAKKRTAREHQGKYQKTYNTARSDLDELVKLELLEKRKLKFRKEAEYVPRQDLMNKLKAGCTQRIKKSRHIQPTEKTYQGGLFDSLFEDDA